MASALDLGTDGPSAQCLSPPRCINDHKWVQTYLMFGVILRWTSILSRGSRNNPSCFMLLKPG